MSTNVNKRTIAKKLPVLKTLEKGKKQMLIKMFKAIAKNAKMQAKIDAKEAQKQAKIDAKEAQKQAKNDAKEAQKQAKIAIKEALKQVKIATKEAEKRAKKMEMMCGTDSDKRVSNADK